MSSSPNEGKSARDYLKNGIMGKSFDRVNSRLENIDQLGFWGPKYYLSHVMAKRGLCRLILLHAFGIGVCLSILVLFVSDDNHGRNCSRGMLPFC